MPVLQAIRGCTNLYPSPHGGEEDGRVDDGDGVESFGVVCGGKRGCLLQVVPERPHGADGDVLEVNDGRDRGDRRGRGGVW